MEKEWLDADASEVTSRDGRKGVAPMELFFSDFHTLLAASASKADNRLKRCDKVAKVRFLVEFSFCNCYCTSSPPRHGPATVEPAWVSPFTYLSLFLQSVNDKRDGLYNKLVASYHKAKTERAALAHELEVARGMFLLLGRLADVFLLFLLCPADALILSACSSCC
jgi:hypothetical protein